MNSKSAKKKKYSTTFSTDILTRFKKACMLQGVRSNEVLENAMVLFITETQELFRGKEVEI